MWIIINNGMVFEGTLEQFQECFFSNANEETIQAWADKERYKVVFVNETPASYRCRYCQDTGKVTLFSFSRPCLDCPPLEEKILLAKCAICGDLVNIPPDTWGYELLRDRGYCLARCISCDCGATFVRIVRQVENELQIKV